MAATAWHLSKIAVAKQKLTPPQLYGAVYTIKETWLCVAISSQKKGGKKLKSPLCQLVFTALVRLQCTGRESNKGEPATKGLGSLVSAPASSKTSITMND